MKKIENKLAVVCVLFISLVLIYIGIGIYNSKAYLDKFEMKIDDIQAECVQNEALYLAELKNFKAGEYNLKFDYELENDAVVKVYSAAGYDLETNSIPIFLEEQIHAGKGNFDSAFNLNDDYLAMTFIIETEGEVFLEGIKVAGDDNYFDDRKITCFFFIVGVVLFASCSIYIILSRKDRADKYISLVIFWTLILIGIVSCYIYLFTNYSSYGHDTRFHMYRIKAIAQSLLNGNIPNRINGVSVLGYGYVNPLLYPELFLYIPAFWVNKGMSELGAVELFYVLFNFVAVFVAYYSFDKICDNKFISLSATAIYTLSYYKLINVYVRGALGEVLFMTFLPLTVYALYTLFYEEKKRWFLLAVSVSTILQSHILGTAMACGLLGMFFIVFTFDLLVKKNFKFRIITELIKSVSWVILANIWFIVPFINAYFTYELTMFDKEEMSSWFLNELLSAGGFLSWKIQAGSNGVFSAVGLIVLAGICIATVLGIVSLLKVKKDRIIVLATSVITVFFGIICTDIVNWEQMMSYGIIKSIVTTLQFSFRFEALFIMSLCFWIVFAAKGLKGKKVKIVSLISTMLVLMCIVPNMKEFIDNATYCRSDLTYRSYSIDRPPEYLKPGANIAQVVLLDKKVTASDNISITDYNKDGVNIDFSVKTDGDKGWIQLPLFYFDDYCAVTESGEELKVYSGDKAFLYVEIPENMGEETVSIRFAQGALYDIPLCISVAFLLSTLAVAFFESYRRKKKTE